MPKDKALGDALRIVHVTLNSLMFAVVCVHVAAALKHHFVDRDAVLTRMLPIPENQRNVPSMIGRLLPLALCALLLGPGVANADSVVVGKSEIAFTVKQMGVNFEGRFRKWKADIDLRPAALDKSKAEVEVDLASLDLASVESEVEAKGPLWFNTSRFPVAHFVSTSIRSLGGRSLRGRRQALAEGRHAGLRRADCREGRRFRQSCRRWRVLAQTTRIQDRRGTMGRPRFGRQRHPGSHPDGASVRHLTRWNNDAAEVYARARRPPMVPAPLPERSLP